MHVLMTYVKFKLRNMFYCDKCRIENKYPESIMVSYGRCEMCGDTAECNDMPSAYLPKDSPKEPEDSPIDFPEISEFITNMKLYSHETQITVLAHIAEYLSLDKTATAIRDSLNK